MPAVITRFAPSPTGNLHIGGLRTALINYIYYKNAKLNFKDSKFYLRLEDTDIKRSKKEYEKSIISGLEWIGLNWDGPIIRQSDNTNKHIDIAYTLLEKKGAFKCICSPQELESKRKKLLLEKKSIKRLCTTCESSHNIQSQKDNYCIRLKINDDKETSIIDEIQGKITISNLELDNYILLRSDKTPTYMLSVVVDDYNMGITHIIRGDDHLNNAFRQYHLYKNLNWNVPKFAHLPLMHGTDGKKLSKRHGSIDINIFKKLGYLPEAILNYLLKLGLSIEEKDIFTLESIIKKFSLKNILKSPSKFDYDKLNYVNSKYIEPINNEILKNKIEKNYKIKYSEDKNKVTLRAINILKKRSKTLIDLKNNIEPFIDNEYLTKIKFILNDDQKQLFKNLKLGINSIDKWEQGKIDIFLNDFIKKNNINFSTIGKPLRLILTGNKDAPPISEIFYILNKQEVIRRLDFFD